MQEINGYTIQETVNEGDRFTILRAIRDSDQKRVILKFCRLELPSAGDLTNLQHEYQILKQLDSSLIVKVYDLVKKGRELILILEDVEGESLKRFLAHKPLDLGVFFKIALQLTTALGDLHIKNVIHKDISPHNILIDPNLLTVKVIDFGLSMQLSQETKDPTPSQNIEGNLEYISPEQTGRMNRAIDYRADFYSLGIVFYEMLAGKLPFETQDTLELIHCHLAKKPPDLHEINKLVPEVVASIIAKLLSKTPEERYASTFGLKADLLKCQAEWHKNHTIERFILGQQDISDHLVISQKVYAREREISKLLEIFERIAHGSRELFLMSGYAGIGKSSIVREIAKPIASQRGYLAKGKYDRLNRTAPYSAFIEAFQGLIHHLLSESDMVLEVIKERLLKALGSNGKIIVTLIPELALIIGEQPPVRELSPSESQSRFVLIFQNFIRALASAEHPLVLFLDDLQWMDNSSLELFKSLLSDPEVRHLLFVGAYQSNEMAIQHPLMDVVQKLKAINLPVTELAILPFNKNDIQNLLADSLNMTTEEVADLANVLLTKTQGNPFFLNELLKKLYHEGLLQFSYDSRKWRWDLEHIRQESVTENVVGLLVGRIEQLPKESRDLLELAALMGNVFELKSLSIMSGYSLAKTAACIWDSIDANLIALMGNHYKILEGIKSEIILDIGEKIEFRFIHERVQQAAYQLIPEETKANTHLKMGRLLLEYFQGEDLKKQDKKLFEILYHFNQGIPLVTDQKECRQLAELYLSGGKKAKMAIAFEDSATYFESGMKVIKHHDWGKDYQLLFDLHLEFSESLFLLKKFDDAETYITELLKHCANNVDSGNVYFTKIKAYSNAEKHPEVLKLAKIALKRLGFNFSMKPRALHILREIGMIYWHNSVKGNQKIRTPATDPRNLIIGRILARACASAYRTDQSLFAYLDCKLINFSFLHGYIPATPLACLGYAAILIFKFQSIKRAFHFVDLAKDLQKKLGDQAELSRSNFLMGALINHWKYPLVTSLEYLEKGYQAGIEEGELSFSIQSWTLKDLMLYCLGKPLMEIKENVEASIGFSNHTGLKYQYDILLFLKRFLSLLIEEDAGLITEIRSIMERTRKGNNKTAVVYTYLMYAMFNYIKGDYHEAQENSEKAYALKDFLKGGMGFVWTLVTHALCLSVNYSKMDKSNKNKTRKELVAIQKQFKQWSVYSPENFLYGYWLISAEIERLDKGFQVKTIQFYNRAIAEAQKYDYTQFVAIANECAARFCFVSEYPLFGKAYLQNAYHAYLQWGATTKCKILEKQYSEILQSRANPISTTISTGSTGMATANLDVLSLLKATQAISGEIQLDKLLQKLIGILLQNAGSERAVLLVKEGNDWFIEAEGTLAGQKITLSQADPLKERTDLPLSLINSVQRTQDVILIQTTRELEIYTAGDLYLKEVRPQSILILPVFYQGVLKNLLYLENKAMSQAFMPASIQTLKMLASQAAISLENARLYRQATHDPLTGLANRNLLYQAFEVALSMAKRVSKNIAILFLDLDGFKKVNDTLGHKIGDLVLLDFSEKIKSCLRDVDLAVRLGGDEFIVMLEGAEINQTILVAERILKTLNNPLKIQDHEIYVGVSIGISIYPEDGDSIQDLLKQADIALYKAKDMGKGRYQFYKPDLNKQLKEKNSQESEIRSAIENNEFRLYYQPIFSSRTRKIICLEALIQWQHPVKGLVVPDDFIPLAEKSGLILPIGDWVLKEVFKQIATWKKQEIQLVPIAVNVSGAQFKKQSMSKIIEKLVEEFQIDPKGVHLEFTEGVFIDDTESVVSDILALKKLGFSLVIDDFGTFYSTLSYLKRFPVDKIKIDKSFIQGVDNNENDRVLVSAIMVMAHGLKLKVTAEGVENEAQAHFLEENGIDELQGFYLGKPMDVKSCTEYLIKGQNLMS